MRFFWKFTEIFLNLWLSKRPIAMNYDSFKTRVVGVDINIEKTTCAVVDIRGDIIATDSFPTNEHPFVGDYASVLGEHILALVQANGGYENIRSIGISAPSGNIQTGCIENSPNLPWKGSIPLAAMLRDRLGLAVALANNAYVMALGEHAFGAAHGMQNFVVISLGSGMGSCFFSNGMPHQGYSGYAGEIGHTCAVVGGRECGCGNKGCLETYTAAKGVIRTAQEVLAESTEPSLMRDAEKLNPKIIAEFCDQGDALAIEVYRRAGHALGMGLANYASILNPEAFIFTGSGAKAGKWLLDPASETFEQHVFHNIKDKVKMIVSQIDDHIRDVLGASVLAWDIEEYSLFK